MIVTMVLAVIGFGVSLYGYYVERTLKRDATYLAACDISDRISCSKPLLSKYSSTLGIPKTIWGMSLYALIFGAAVLHLSPIVWWLTIGAAVGTVWFAYLLFFKVKAFCLVCITIYIINFLLLLVSWYNI